MFSPNTSTLQPPGIRTTPQMHSSPTSVSSSHPDSLLLPAHTRKQLPVFSEPILGLKRKDEESDASNTLKRFCDDLPLDLSMSSKYWKRSEITNPVNSSPVSSEVIQFENCASKSSDVSPALAHDPLDNSPSKRNEQADAELQIAPVQLRETVIKYNVPASVKSATNSNLFLENASNSQNTTPETSTTFTDSSPFRQSSQLDPNASQTIANNAAVSSSTITIPITKSANVSTLANSPHNSDDDQENSQANHPAPDIDLGELMQMDNQVNAVQPAEGEPAVPLETASNQPLATCPPPRRCTLSKKPSTSKSGNPVRLQANKQRAQVQPQPTRNVDQLYLLFQVAPPKKHSCFACWQCKKVLEKDAPVKKCLRCHRAFEINGKCDVEGFVVKYTGTIKTRQYQAQSCAFLEVCTACQDREALHYRMEETSVWMLKETDTTNCFGYFVTQLSLKYDDEVKAGKLKHLPFYDLSSIYDRYEPQCIVDNRIDLKTMENKTINRQYESFEELLLDFETLVHNIAVLLQFLEADDEKKTQIAEHLQEIKVACLTNTEDIVRCPSCFFTYCDVENLSFEMPCHQLHALVWYFYKKEWWIGKVFKTSKDDKSGISTTKAVVKLFGDDLGNPANPPITVDIKNLYQFSLRSPKGNPLNKKPSDVNSKSLQSFFAYKDHMNFYFKLQHNIPQYKVRFTARTPFFWKATPTVKYWNWERRNSSSLIID